MVYLLIVGAIVAVVALYAYLVAPARVPRGMDELWTAHYAHRGLYNKDQRVPENSLAAFAAATEAGYGMELDITITADDEVVVFHDDMLTRACSVDKDIRDCTLNELRTCRLFGTQEGIPLFSEMLELVDGRVPLIVELKSTARYRKLCAEAAALLDVYAGTYCVESFDPRIVRWFYKHRPGVVRGQLACGIRSYETTSFYQSFLMSALLTNAMCRPHFVAYRHQDAYRKAGLRAFRLMGGRLVAWTVQNYEDAQYLRKLFDTIIFEFFRP